VFQIEENYNNNSHLIALKNKDGSSKVIINLAQGGSVKELLLKHTIVIKNDLNFKYEDSYASAVLFPFANRIKNGKYSFEGKNYQLDCNHKQNAIHGLVFNKNFNLLEYKVGEKKASLTIQYKEQNSRKGFPFLYAVFITYTLTDKKLYVSIKIKNTDTQSFPFTLGWHPYFYSDNLSESVVSFSSDKKVELDENGITKELTTHQTALELKIKDTFFDDSYTLQNDTIEFFTPKYQLKITSDSLENYIQMYTPKNRKMIAIEPMTGVSDSFNNKVGLQILNPNQEFNLKWKLHFKKTENN
jgi:aldose 1-epimerase